MLSCITFNLTYSSIIGAAIHVVVKSAAKRVIRFGRYLWSLNVQGKTISGTVGVRAKIDGSQIQNTANLINVVEIISNSNAKKHPNVADA